MYVKEGILPHTENEYVRRSDVYPKLPNGTSGNGSDDDCDGLVDEGCACRPDYPVGTTRGCWLVPPRQVDDQSVVRFEIASGDYPIVSDTLCMH
jgi:hypothetical protein